MCGCRQVRRKALNQGSDRFLRELFASLEIDALMSTLQGFTPKLEALQTQSTNSKIAELQLPDELFQLLHYEYS